MAHSITSPPAEDRGCDITLKLLNSRGRVELSKGTADFQTEYLLSIPDPQSLGLRDFEQNHVNSFIEDMILSANLLLQRAALSAAASSFAEPLVEFAASNQVAVVENGRDEKTVTVLETIVLRDTVHIEVGLIDEIDEEKLVSMLGLVNVVNRIDADNPSGDAVVKRNNLTKSLNEYRTAMSVFSRFMTFKHLFNSLELAVNWDGVDRKNTKFDNEAASVCNSNTSEIRSWREFYNRTKHIDRNSRQIQTYTQGIEDLPRLLTLLRSAAEKAIVDRLRTFRSSVNPCTL